MLCIYLQAPCRDHPPGMKQGSAWWRYCPSPSPRFHSAQERVVILLGWHSPWEREFYERDPTQLPNQSVQTGVAKVKVRSEAGRRKPQESPGQHFCGGPTCLSISFPACKRDCASGAEGLNWEPRRVQGTMGEMRATTEMKVGEVLLTIPAPHHPRRHRIRAY